MTVKEITNKIKHILEELSYPSAVAYLTLNDKKWLKAAIKALEQEPCEDAISRQAVIDAMRKNHRSGGRDIDGDYIEGDYRECLYDDIISLPPVNPQNCDTCEVGNPCLYCKHEFEERSDEE